MHQQFVAGYGLSLAQANQNLAEDFYVRARLHERNVGYGAHCIDRIPMHGGHFLLKPRMNTYETTDAPARIRHLSPRQSRKLHRFKPDGARVCIDKNDRVVVVLDKYGKFI